MTVTHQVNKIPEQKPHVESQYPAYVHVEQKYVSQFDDNAAHDDPVAATTLASSS